MKKAIKIPLLVLGVIILAGLVSYLFFPGMFVKYYSYSRLSKAKVSTHTVDAAGHAITYFEGGTGHKDTIVLIHGYGGQKDNFAELAGQLVQKYRVIAPDLPGFGETRSIEAITYNADTNADIINSFTAALKLKQFYLAGASMGGIYSGTFAAKYPDKVLALILIGSGGIDTPVKSPFWNEVMNTMQNPLEYTTPEGYQKAMEYVINKKIELPSSFIRYFVNRKINRLPSERKIWNDLSAAGVNQLTEKLTLIPQNTLILWGENDRIMDKSAVQVLEKGLKNRRTVIIKEGAHAVFITHPAECYKAIDAFIVSAK